jgi:hypothetical protein
MVEPVLPGFDGISEEYGESLFVKPVFQQCFLLECISSYPA